MLISSIVIGIIFGFLAALAAFVITYNEYEKHKFTRKRLFMQAFKTAIFTFLIFLLLSVLISFLLTHFVINSQMSALLKRT